MCKDINRSFMASKNFLTIVNSNQHPKVKNGNCQSKQKEKKGSLVALSNAIVNPNTVMVKPAEQARDKRDRKR